MPNSGAKRLIKPHYFLENLLGHFTTALQDAKSNYQDQDLPIVVYAVSLEDELAVLKTCKDC
jgi:hypothetical protein